MDRSEQITLITQTYSTDAVGNQIPEEKGLTVFCQVQSVGRGEFFEAGREGLRPEYKVQWSDPGGVPGQTVSDLPQLCRPGRNGGALSGEEGRI